MKLKHILAASIFAVSTFVATPAPPFHAPVKVQLTVAFDASPDEDDGQYRVTNYVLVGNRVDVAGPTRIVRIACGRQHTSAIFGLEDGTWSFYAIAMAGDKASSPSNAVTFSIFHGALVK